ncbi:hypothetical protein DOO78_06895 [Roseicella frigidaeris]|uniref:Uncharacterized protein n=1 Tax=Roseicella frigidaeris TaxID=2230885 RepID=A0A327MD35_9PROT|nr:hypothetical protein DOO78_06895 [Roseicella frigidaeris]
MADAPSPPPPGALPEVPPHLQGAACRYRRLLARGRDPDSAFAELVAHLVVLRPGLPRVLAQEQAEAVVAALGPAAGAAPRPPRRLLLALARPAALSE